MLALHPHIIVNEQGRKTGVILDMAEFEQILALLQTVSDPPITVPPLGEAQDILGMFTDPEPPLIANKPVSEFADLYLYGSPPPALPKRRRKTAKPRGRK